MTFHWVLTEFLTSYAHKWCLIGTALKSLPQDMDYVQAKHASMVDFDWLNLISIISDWVLRKKAHTIAHTVNNLEYALASKIVGLGDLARGMKSKVAFNLSTKSHYTLPYRIITAIER